MIKTIPVTCIDVIITELETGMFLLVKRSEAPLKNRYWPVGGRKHIGESITSSAHRIIQSEIGLRKTDIYVNPEIFGFYHDLYSESSFGCHRYETISFVVNAEISISKKKGIVMNNSVKAIRSSKLLPKRFLNNFYRVINENRHEDFS